ncbi:MAG: hypothetical protein KAQ93_03610 [Spirochaetales bacterium]|nr:hypothetical protein [Spirochaetales bacterium]
MQHIAVLINLVSLIMGVVAGSILITRYINYPSLLLVSFLKFFFAYSYLIIIAALFSYLVINVSSAAWVQSLFACLVFVGMSFMILTLPGFTFKEMGLTIPEWFRKLILVSALITGSQAPVLWFSTYKQGVTLPILIAFIPFIFVVTVTLYKQRMFNKTLNRISIQKKEFFTYYIFIIFFITAGLETIFGSYLYRNGKFIIISLPLAYSLSAIQIIKKYSSQSEKTAGLLAEEIITKFKLTSREIEMAEKILKGASNKEIAYELDLSQNTVRNHIYNLYQKLDIQKRMDLVNLTNPE